MSDRPVRRTQAKRSAVLHVGICASVGAALWTALLFLAAFLALQKDWSGTALTVSAYVCCAISAFLCSFFCARSAPKHKALLGMAAVLPMLLLLAVLCLALYGKIGGGFGIACLTTVCSAVLGSIPAVRKKPKKRYKKIGAVR